MKQIPLTQGKFAIVDDDMFDYLSQWKWHVTTEGYPARNTSRKVPGGRKKILMHNEIMQPPYGMEVDHRDWDGLNNQRHNMRNCTHAQNMQNKGKRASNTSGYTGVYWNETAKKWHAQIKNGKSLLFLGLFDVAEDGARAYDEKAREIRGDFAVTNF